MHKTLFGENNMSIKLISKRSFNAIIDEIMTISENKNYICSTKNQVGTLGAVQIRTIFHQVVARVGSRTSV